MAFFSLTISGNFDDIEKKLNKILSNQTFIIHNMSKKSDFDALTARLEASHTAISESLQIEDVAAQIRSLADQTPEPPAPEPEV